MAKYCSILAPYSSTSSKKSTAQKTRAAIVKQGNKWNARTHGERKVI